MSLIHQHFLEQHAFIMSGRLSDRRSNYSKKASSAAQFSTKHGSPPEPQAGVASSGYNGLIPFVASPVDVKFMRDKDYENNAI